MNKRVAVWVVGGLVTVSALGLGFNTTIGRAAEKAPQTQMMQTNPMGNMMGNMDPKAMADMMKTPEMQKQCAEMMKNPEMQKAMKDMMKTPEMQGMMKQMLQQDMGFHQMMSDLVNSVDMNSDHSMSPASSGSQSPNQNEHGGHHG